MLEHEIIEHAQKCVAAKLVMAENPVEEGKFKFSSNLSLEEM